MLESVGKGFKSLCKLSAKQLAQEEWTGRRQHTSLYIKLYACGIVQVHFHVLVITLGASDPRTRVLKTNADNAYSSTRVLQSSSPSTVLEFMAYLASY